MANEVGESVNQTKKWKSVFRKTNRKRIGEIVTIIYNDSVFNLTSANRIADTTKMSSTQTVTASVRN